eukprot:403375302
MDFSYKLQNAKHVIGKNEGNQDDLKSKLKTMFAKKLKSEIVGQSSIQHNKSVQFVYQPHEKEFIKGTNNNDMLDALRQECKDENSYFVSSTFNFDNKRQSADMDQLYEHIALINRLMKEDLYTTMKQYEFIKLIQNQKVLDDVAHRLYERDPIKIKDQVHFKQSLKYSDKDLYMKFRDEKITYDQFLARVEEKRFGTVYKVLDDLKGKIDERFIMEEKDDIIAQRALKFAQQRGYTQSEMGFMAGKKCVRSIFKEVTKEDKIMLNASRSLDQQMDERHRKEVTQRKIDNELNLHQKNEESFFKSEKKINRILTAKQNARPQRQSMSIKNPKMIELETKLRSAKFNERLKQTLKQNFEQYKLESVERMADSTNPMMKFYQEQLSKDLSQQQKDKVKEVEEMSSQENLSIKDEKISQQQLLIIRRKQESKELKQRDQQMRFINRLKLDQENVISDESRQLLNNVQKNFRQKISQNADQVDVEVVQKLLKFKTLKDAHTDRKLKTAQYSARLSLDSKMSTQLPGQNSTFMQDQSGSIKKLEDNAYNFKMTPCKTIL